jgi:hypothetical protein
MPLIPPPKTYPTRPFKAGRTSAQADWLPVEITDPPCDDLSFCSTDCLGDVEPSLQPHIVSLRQLVVLSRKPSRHSLVSHHTRPCAFTQSQPCLSSLPFQEVALQDTTCKQPRLQVMLSKSPHGETWVRPRLGTTSILFHQDSIQRTRRAKGSGRGSRHTATD